MITYDDDDDDDTLIGAKGQQRSNVVNDIFMITTFGQKYLLQG